MKTSSIPWTENIFLNGQIQLVTQRRQKCLGSRKYQEICSFRIMLLFFFCLGYEKYILEDIHLQKIKTFIFLYSIPDDFKKYLIQFKNLIKYFSRGTGHKIPSYKYWTSWRKSLLQVFGTSFLVWGMLLSVANCSIVSLRLAATRTCFYFFLEWSSQMVGNLMFLTSPSSVGPWRAVLANIMISFPLWPWVFKS